ncbi:MAG: TatD DNase family protein [Thermoleophilaceae bacterium]|nr:TatD DNase family protein [Thermoleophilaceae bacterium]
MVDTHCHLDSCKPPDDELVRRARELGVRRIATVGMNDASIERALAAANAHAEVVAIVGRHPNEAQGFQAHDIEPVERAAADPRVRAIGETGLDYYRDYAPRADQLRAFEAHVELAKRCGLPLVIHTRAAEDDTIGVLREQADGVTVIMHCFSMPDRLEECVERGWLCSFAGNVTYPKATDLQQAAREVPDELLLVETDAPYLSPQPVRGKPNEPANVVRTAEFVAELRGVPYAELEATVERNAARVFGW